MAEQRSRITLELESRSFSDRSGCAAEKVISEKCGCAVVNHYIVEAVYQLKA